MTVQLRQLRQMHQNFNSHPHEEDDGAPYVIDKLEDISTHILTKRMTERQWLEHRLMEYFNSHPHEEDDVELFTLFDCFDNISTHILTKRMTVQIRRS